MTPYPTLPALTGFAQPGRQSRCVENAVTQPERGRKKPTLDPTTQPLLCSLEPQYVNPATPLPTGKGAIVPRRRFQQGSFVKLKNGGMYSMHYVDAVGPDGSATTKQVKQFIGNLSQMSERAARREHANIMERVNRERGSLKPVLKGQTFADAVKKWRSAIARNLSPATVRPRESYLRASTSRPRSGS